MCNSIWRILCPNVQKWKHLYLKLLTGSKFEDYVRLSSYQINLFTCTKYDAFFNIIYFSKEDNFGPHTDDMGAASNKSPIKACK